MNKVLMAALLVAVFAGFAMAQTSQATDAVDVQVTVNGLWSITLDNPSIDFGSIDPEDAAVVTADVTAYIKTNHKTIPWALQLSQNRVLTSGSETIASPNFTFVGSGGIAGGVWAAITEFPLITPATVYTAALGEYFTMGAGTPLLTTYTLDVPSATAAGIYTNTITYTLISIP